MKEDNDKNYMPRFHEIRSIMNKVSVNNPNYYEKESDKTDHYLKPK